MGEYADGVKAMARHFSRDSNVAFSERTGQPMIYFRMYTLKPGATQDYMAAVRELALPIRQKYGVKLAG